MILGFERMSSMVIKKKPSFSKPVNKTITSKIVHGSIKKDAKKGLEKTIKSTANLSVSIIASTNKPKYMNNIFDNYKRQNYKNKELIIILNNNKIDIERWKKEKEKYENIRVFQIDENEDLSDCINFGVSKSSADLIAKFDDDDYYGPNYLNEAIEAITSTKAGVVGKSKYYAYFEDINKTGLRKKGSENKYTNYIHGPTLVMKRSIIEEFKFINMSQGADQQFLKDCAKNGIKIHSTSIKNFVYFRHSSLEHHTWKIDNKKFLKGFTLLSSDKDYKDYAN